MSKTEKTIKYSFIAILIFLVFLFNLFGLNFVFGTYYELILKPLFWTFLLIIVLIFFKTSKIQNPKYEKDIIIYIIILVSLYFLVYFFTGFIQGFGHNPYSRTVLGIIYNSWGLIPVLLAKKYIRNFMIKNIFEKNFILNVFLIGFLFTLPEIKASFQANNFTSISV